MCISAGWREVSSQHFKRCSLSCTIYSQQSETFALRYTQTQTVYCQVTTLLTGLVDLQVAIDCNSFSDL